MSSKKLTAKKREELRILKEKQHKNQQYEQSGQNFQKKSFIKPLLVLLVVVIISVAGIYLVLKNTGQTNTANQTNVKSNRNPVSTADYTVVKKNSENNVVDLIANDNDADGDSLTITNIATPSNGTAEIRDNKLYYTPEKNFNGVIKFSYSISDKNNGTSTSTVHMIIADTYPIAEFDTSMGTIIAELYTDKVSITAGNFKELAESGYYNGVIFHRVIPNFMIQGGDPLGTGTDGHAAKYHQGYGNPDNPDTWVIPDEFHNDLSNIRGTISMANSGPNSGGSQFFINIVDNIYLDFNKYIDPTTREIIYKEVPYPQDSSKHAVFGKIIDGMDVVDAISQVDTNPSNNKPYTDVVINSITIIE